MSSNGRIVVAGAANVGAPASMASDLPYSPKHDSVSACSNRVAFGALLFLLCIVSWHALPAEGDHFVLGRKAAERGQFRESIQYYDEALRNPELEENGPVKASILVNRARSLFELGQFEAALLDLNQALKVNGVNNYAYFLRGVVNIELAYLDEAIRDLDKYIHSGGPLLEARLQRGIAFGKYGDNDKAISDLEYVLKKRPSDLMANSTLGLIFANLGDFGKSLEYFNAAINVNGIIPLTQVCQICRLSGQN